MSLDPVILFVLIAVIAGRIVTWVFGKAARTYRNYESAKLAETIDEIRRRGGML